MERMDVNGVGIAYELIGKAGDPAVALTPGGRFTMDVPGLREMAELFAERFAPMPATPSLFIS